MENLEVIVKSGDTMPPKKREKEAEGQNVPKTDQIQADHELFLQAFESE